jgi:hypothetical protein
MNDDNGELDGSALDSDGLPHAVKVMSELLDPWKDNGERIVGGDSWFASVPAVMYLRTKGFGYVSPIKTATKEYPMAHLLQSLEVQRCGDFKYMRTEEGGDDQMTAVMWVDRDCKYSVGNGETAMIDGPYFRTCWRQLEPVASNADASCVEISQA